MQEQLFSIAGMHCQSCEKLITRSLEEIGVQVKSIDYVKKQATVAFDPEKNSLSSIEKSISEVGYEASPILADQSPFSESSEAEGFWTRLKKVRQSMKENPEVFAFEKKILGDSLGTLLVVAALMFVVYLVLFWNVTDFWSRYGYYMIFLTLAVIAAGVSVRHLRAYRASVSCMSGMMIGMTVGMISSMMIGMSIGATNGMFAGAIFSMMIGMGFGAWVGATCGIMGVMEGMMAGLMGGTMGPMISVMMISDHLKPFFPIFFVACFMILAGLMYMVFKEHRSRKVVVKAYPFWTFTGVSFLIIFLGTLIMMWGPRASFLVR